jgi:iron complex transport system ATP-binding protein
MTASGLCAERVVVRAGDRRILDQASILVRPNGLVALVGPNGAGKTTLLRALAGELRPDEGEVRLDDAPLAKVKARDLARERAVLPQTTSVEFAFTAAEIVQMGRAPHRSSPVDDAEIVAESMAATECAHLGAREYRTLSGGEQARVNLARVLAQRTRFLLLDEPTAALDLRHQELVMRLAADRAVAGDGVVAVVHDLNLAAAYATEVCMMRDGRTVAHGTPHEILTADLVSEVYGYRVEVLEHPTRGCPLIVPVGPLAEASATGTAARQGEGPR